MEKTTACGYSNHDQDGTRHSPVADGTVHGTPVVGILSGLNLPLVPFLEKIFMIWFLNFFFLFSLNFSCFIISLNFFFALFVRLILVTKNVLFCHARFFPFWSEKLSLLRSFLRGFGIWTRSNKFLFLFLFLSTFLNSWSSVPIFDFIDRF